MLVTVLLPFIYAGITLIYHAIVSKGVEDALFDNKTTLNNNSLLKAYICLALRMISTENDMRSEKFKYISSYFYRHFPESKDDIQTIFKNAFQNPIDVHVISSWLKIHLNYEKRTQVMYFLFGLSYVDGRIDPHELRLLKPLADTLEITPKDFESIFAMYKQKEQHQKVKTTNKSSEKKIAAKILGVSEFASIDEIKKAYRQLAKLHHPDKYASESIEQRKIAEERFIEIQTAYEIMVGSV